MTAMPPALRCAALAVSVLALGAPAGTALQAPERPAPQAPSAPQPQAVPGPFAQPRSSLITLRAILESREAKRAELAAKNRELEAEPNRERQLVLLEEARSLQAQIAELDLSFEAVATGIDVPAFMGVGRDSFDIRSELENLLQPIIQELKAATEDPRQLEQLRAELAFQQERQRLARAAITHLETLVGESRDAELRAQLEASLAAWRNKLKETQNRETVARFQLDTRLQERKSLIQSTRSVFSSFFRSRGRNILLAGVTLLGVFLGLRFLYDRLRRISPVHRRKNRAFYVRLIDVVFFLFTGVAAVFAALLVLYVAGDWVLLGITLLFLLGIVWASKTALPQQFEQVRLLLNLGSVREQERVLHEGLPWRVSRLSLYTLLANPELTGGVIRLPIRALVGLNSRPYSDKELWFPCRPKDWVFLADGRRGKVLLQTPETVRIELLGGSKVTYRTADFLALNPELMSDGFRVSVTFGIDYRHQAICTTEVPQAMRARLEKELSALIGAEHVRAVSVEFQEAGASSLDYLAQVDVDGEVAERYERIRRALQRILVDECNDQGWVIPFTQITLHQA